jgi:hypothetical protein
MDLRTAEVLKLGLEHFDLPSLAALSATNKFWRPEYKQHYIKLPQMQRSSCYYI